MEKLLKPAEVAEKLRVTVATLAVWRCTKRRGLQYVKQGRAVLYREADVEAYLAALPALGGQVQGSEA